MHPEHLAVTVIGYHLHESDGLARCQRPPVGREVKTPNPDIVVLLACLLLGKANHGYFGEGIHHGRRGKQLHGALVSFHRGFGGHLAHAEGHVREHLDAVHVAGRVNTFHAGLHILIHLNSSLFGLKLDLAHSLHIGNTSDRHQGAVGDNRLFAVYFYLQLVAFIHDLGDTSRGNHLHPFLLDIAGKLFRHLVIEVRHDAIHHLDDGHFRAQACKRLSHLGTDHATADNGQGLGHLLDGQQVVAGKHLIVLDPGNIHLGHFRTAGQNNLIGFDNLGIVNHHVFVLVDLPNALEYLHAVALEKPLHAAGKLSYHAVLELLHLLHIDLECRGIDNNSSRCRHFDMLDDLHVLQVGLGRYTSHVEAGSPEDPFLHDRHLRPQLSRFDGRHVTRGSTRSEER